VSKLGAREKMGIEHLAAVNVLRDMIWEKAREIAEKKQLEQSEDTPANPDKNKIN
jgi:hypothetical protein